MFLRKLSAGTWLSPKATKARLSVLAPQQSRTYASCFEQTDSSPRMGYIARFNSSKRLTLLRPQVRSYVTDSERFYTNMRVLNKTFEEARTAIDEARESTGTTYYAEDYEDAEKITKNAIGQYDDLLKHTTDESQRDQLTREHGQRMKQLQEEFKTLQAP